MATSLYIEDCSSEELIEELQDRGYTVGLDDEEQTDYYKKNVLLIYDQFKNNNILPTAHIREFIYDVTGKVL
jgi:deoxyadenosine/deoxycytidine kinase